MDVSQFDFALPKELIALRPADPRDGARMLVVAPDGRLEHRKISDFPGYFGSGDVLVANNSRVIPARFRGRRLPRSASSTAEPKIEVLLCRRRGPCTFMAFSRPARKLSVGDKVRLGLTITAEISARGEAGEVELTFPIGGAELDAAISAEGEVPLPPYIAGQRKVDARDATDYQTVVCAR